MLAIYMIQAEVMLGHKDFPCRNFADSSNSCGVHAVVAPWKLKVDDGGNDVMGTVCDAIAEYIIAYACNATFVCIHSHCSKMAEVCPVGHPSGRKKW